jgi:hypothetical protein
MFRRTNSYTVPLNPQEKRHALYQGDFKWFIVALSEKYAQALKQIGVFSESQLSRMNDASLLTDICLTHIEGIHHASEAKLNTFYANRDQTFPEHDMLTERIDTGFTYIRKWESIHNTSLLRPYNFYTLMLAVSHMLRRNPVLEPDFPSPELPTLSDEYVLPNLGRLTAAIDDSEPDDALSSFVEACAKATNRMNPRKQRFEWFCCALQPRLL